MGDEQTRLAAVIDPHGEVHRILAEAERRRLRITYIINTHSHWDHVAGNPELVAATGAKVVMHRLSPRPKDLAVGDWDEIKVGSLRLKVIHTPGHSPDEICLLAEGKLFTGDTLFVGNCGRTDLPGGSPEEMYDSLFNKILKLGDHVEIYPGHDYGEKPSSTIGYEREHNYTLKPRTREEFVRFMSGE